jgi:dTDP-4-dehydrorhamnose 3,5-epimerase-like enzyme
MTGFLNLIKIINFPETKGINGELYVYESEKIIPFDIKRTFLVRANSGDIRGEHSHKQCSQLLICINGRISVTCEDAMEKITYELSDPSHGLLIPPGIWASQNYIDNDSMLIVFCDRFYEEFDYIRDYHVFKNMEK